MRVDGTLRERHDLDQTIGRLPSNHSPSWQPAEKTLDRCDRCVPRPGRSIKVEVEGK